MSLLHTNHPSVLTQAGSGWQTMYCCSSVYMKLIGANSPLLRSILWAPLWRPVGRLATLHFLSVPWREEISKQGERNRVSSVEHVRHNKFYGNLVVSRRIGETGTTDLLTTVAERIHTRITFFSVHYCR
ncbi:hypothetical protein BaRGS_00026297 [Batillaria attramentaria]|uniref:Uncharacterized protein n=1 Tax=Batillaria attramentaria TaxID=370345 RepID=A0ABD0K4Z6_9CAEN